MLCFNVSGLLGMNTWTNRIFYDNFSDLGWKKSFYVDSWNNTASCCADSLVRQTFNNVDNVYNNNETLVLKVSPVNTIEILAYSSSISSYENNIQYGSFRVSAKLPALDGSSIGFFYYHSDTEEIDMEFLTHERAMRTSIQPIIRDSFGTAMNISQKSIPIDKNPAGEFIEYRFDWFKERVDFFIGGVYTNTLSVNIPRDSGKFVINHRTNGNPKWSRGPPVADSELSIKYIDMYFNSSINGECSGENSRNVGVNSSGNKSGNGNGKNNTPLIIIFSLVGFFVLLFIGLFAYNRMLKKPVVLDIPTSSNVNVPEQIEMEIASRRP